MLHTFGLHHRSLIVAYFRVLDYFHYFIDYYFPKLNDKEIIYDI